VNERILELAEQAGFDVETLVRPYPGGFPREDMLALESFAELIVKECMKVCDQSLSKHELPSDKIAEHFGVEP
jgi:hypothetical protein